MPTTAQHFSPFHDGQVNYYANNENAFIAVALDSVVHVGDTTWYYNYSTIKEIGYDNWCWQPDHASWLGSECFITDSILKIINRSEDTIRIPLMDYSHSGWVLLDEGDGRYISTQAEIIEVNDFLGDPDTVLSIYLQPYGFNSDESYHIETLEEIRISRNHGLIKFPDLYEFPYAADWPTTTSNSSYNMVGFDDFGEKPMELKDAFDMRPGEEFHYLDSYQCAPYYENESKEIHKILERRYNYEKDSVIFIVERIIKRTSRDYDNNYMPLPDTTVYGHDTIQSRYFIGSFYPLVPISHNEDMLLNYEVFAQSDYPGRRQMQSQDPFWKTDDECYELLLADGGTWFYYVEGLGEMNYSTSYFCLSTADNIRKVVYFKKETEEWGVPHSRSELLGVDLPNVKNHVSIYPVPFSENITVELAEEISSPCTLTLYDTRGLLVIKRKLLSSLNRVFTTSIPEGIYMLKIEFSDGKIFTQKLLKKNR